jgi:hypothetical protein
MPVIIATEKAEIMRIVVQSQPQDNSSQEPILKIPNTKRAGGVAQGVGPEFKSEYQKKKKERKKEGEKGKKEKKEGEERREGRKEGRKRKTYTNLWEGRNQVIPSNTQ